MVRFAFRISSLASLDCNLCSFYVTQFEEYDHKKALMYDSSTSDLIISLLNQSLRSLGVILSPVSAAAKCQYLGNVLYLSTGKTLGFTIRSSI